MATVGARRRELAQLVADHRLRYEHRHVLATVVHRDRVPDELGEDRGGARPGLEHALLLAVVHLLDPLHQLGVDERPLLARRLLLVARAIAQRRLAPRRDRVAALVLALAATVRVVDRVHDGAAHGRALTLPARAAGLAAGLVLVRLVAELPDGRAAGLLHTAHLAGRQTQQRHPALLGDQLRGAAGRAHHLAALSRAKLDVVHRGAGWDARQRQGVPGPDVDAGAALDGLADLKPRGRQDVALLAVGIVQQRDPAGSVGVVLDRVHLGGHAVLLALEVDDPVAPLVAAALVAGGDAAVVVAPGV